MGYSPKHNYRAKDHLERGNPDKIVRGYELSEDFEAISREVADISYQLGDLQVNVGGGMNLDDLKDVSAALPDRDNLIIWNGTQWVSDSFGFIETSLTFQGGYDLTSSAPADPKDGDLYISNSDGTVDASWGPIGGTPVVAGNVVGYAESKGRWYLLGDLASTAVTSVGEGLGISVEDSKPREPVVGINRDDVDEWYADKEATENRFVDIETNITEIEGDITDIKTDIGDLEVNIENNLQGNYEPKIDPKNTAFNKNFGTNVGEVAQGNHDHNTLYEPIITPKNSAFNKAFGSAAGQVAAGNHNHDAVYIKDAPKDGEIYVRKDGAWEKSAGGGGGGGSIIWWEPSKITAGMFTVTVNGSVKTPAFGAVATGEACKQMSVPTGSLGAGDHTIIVKPSTAHGAGNIIAYDATWVAQAACSRIKTYADNKLIIDCDGYTGGFGNFYAYAGARKLPTEYMIVAKEIKIVFTYTRSSSNQLSIGRFASGFEC